MIEFQFPNRYRLPLENPNRSHLDAGVCTLVGFLQHAVDGREIADDPLRH